MNNIISNKPFMDHFPYDILKAYSNDGSQKIYFYNNKLAIHPVRKFWADEGIAFLEKNVENWYKAEIITIYSQSEEIIVDTVIH